VGTIVLGGLPAAAQLIEAWREGRRQHAGQIAAGHRVATPDEPMLDPIMLHWRLLEQETGQTDTHAALSMECPPGSVLRQGVRPFPSSTVVPENAMREIESLLRSWS
jgi:hypothetical protein